MFFVKNNGKHLTYYSADAALASPNFQRTGQHLKAHRHCQTTDEGYCTRNLNSVNGGHRPAKRSGAVAQTREGFYPISKTCQTGLHE